MNITKKTYPKYADAHAPRSKLWRDTARAYLSGGLICATAEGVRRVLLSFGVGDDDASLLTSVSLVLLSAILTSLGVFDDIAKVTGAGTLVPITGFANSVVSSAIDSKNEGLVLGLGAGIFSVAGPVLLYGTAAGAIYGVIYWIFG